MRHLTLQLALPALALIVGADGAWAVQAEASHAPIEIRQRLDTSQVDHRQEIALTLDACGGAYDARLIATLVRLRVPATLFVTQRWLERNGAALRELQAHPELFELENHGSQHVPAVVGGRLYGMPGPLDIAGVEREVSGGAQAVARAAGKAPTWYRGAGAAYDRASLERIRQLGLRVAGFSLNADDGATASAQVVTQRLLKAQPGDVILAHMNHPASGTAAGLAAALPELQRRGLNFVKLSQAAGVNALPGSPGHGKAAP